jgi:glucose/mannose transport system substrate-binding protein
MGTADLAVSFYSTPDRSHRSALVQRPIILSQTAKPSTDRYKGIAIDYISTSKHVQGGNKMRVSPSLVGLAFAAALSSVPAMAAEPQKAEVIHWWTSGGEATAVKVFADAYDKAGGQWVDSAIAGGGGEAARTAGINRIVGGNPPTMMQFNTGKQLDELVSNSYLANLDDAANAGHWKDLLPKPIVDASMRDGHWYALPVNIHGANWLFYNTKVFADAGIPEPKTWSDVLAAGPKLKAKGIIPFAHGGQAWQDHVLFDAVLAGEGGSDLYLSVYGKDPQKAIASPGFNRVAEVLIVTGLSASSVWDSSNSSVTLSTNAFSGVIPSWRSITSL